MVGTITPRISHKRLIYASFCLLLLVSEAFAGDSEVRTYSVTVGGKASGSYVIHFEATADGKEIITSKVDVKGRVLLIPYHYSHQSREVWDKGQLVSVDAKTNDDGKKNTFRAVVAKDAWTLTVNNRERTEKGTYLLSDGFRMPTIVGKEQAVVVCDTEDGTMTDAKLSDLGVCNMRVKDQQIAGQSFKLTGKDLDSEWWFDASGRPIRQAMVWDGHKIVVELIEIKK